MEENSASQQNQQKSESSPKQVVDFKKPRKSKKEKQEAVQKVSLLDQAKQMATTLESNQLQTVLQMEEFKDQLSKEEKERLRFFINNRKKASKNQKRRDSEESSSQIQHFNEETWKNQNNEISDIHYELTVRCTNETRRQKIIDLVKSNIFNFLTFMEHQQSSPTDDFLPLIIDLYTEFEESIGLKLFVRVCKLFKDEDLNVSSDMIQKSMKYLLEEMDSAQAAFGLLRIVFKNTISFFDFETETLVGFQLKYRQILQNFFQSYPNIDKRIYQNLPATCFIFTFPLIEELQDGGSALHQNVPFQFLPYFIEIIGYSFDNSLESFSDFIKTFKNLCLCKYEKLLKNNFHVLLAEIASQYKQRNLCFFKSLAPASAVLRKILTLLVENKIDIFEDQVIQSLLSGKESSYQDLLKNQRIVETIYHEQEDVVLTQFQQLNGIEFEDNDNFSKQSQEKAKKVFSALGIQSVLPVQWLCIKYCMSNLRESLFVKFDIGFGKTSLCLVLAVLQALNNKKVIIVNKSESLAFRDFKKAQEISKFFNVKIQFSEDQSQEKRLTAQITYVTLSRLTQLAQENMKEFEKVFCIVDESDLIFLDNETNLDEMKSLFQKFARFIAFSGSNLSNQHKSFLEQVFKATCIEFPRTVLKQNLVVRDKAIVTTTFKNYKENIIDICLNQIYQTPVIIILNQQIKEISAMLDKKKIIVKNLQNETLPVIEAALFKFEVKVEEKYQVFIINEEQGRGIDFKSSSEIEANGGVYLIVGCLPQRILQYQQFLGRTGRIGNKGQYSVVLYDKHAGNQTGDFYLDQKLSELDNAEVLILNSLDQNHSQIVLTSPNQMIKNKALQQNELVAFHNQDKNERRKSQEEEKHQSNQGGKFQKSQDNARQMNQCPHPEQTSSLSDTSENILFQKHTYQTQKLSETTQQCESQQGKESRQSLKQVNHQVDSNNQEVNQKSSRKRLFKLTKNEIKLLQESKTEFYKYKQTSLQIKDHISNLSEQDESDQSDDQDYSAKLFNQLDFQSKKSNLKEKVLDKNQSKVDLKQTFQNRGFVAKSNKRQKKYMGKKDTKQENLEHDQRKLKSTPENDEQLIVSNN